MCQGNRPEADRALRPDCSKRGARTAVLRCTHPLLARQFWLKPAGFSFPLCQGQALIRCQLRGDPRLRVTPPKSEPPCRLGMPHRATLRPRTGRSADAGNPSMPSNSGCWLTLMAPSLYTWKGEVRATQRVELTHLIPWLQETVEFRRAQLAGVTLEPFGKGLHFAIPWEDPVAQLVLRLRANLARNGFVFSYEPHPHITWL